MNTPKTDTAIAEFTKRTYTGSCVCVDADFACQLELQVQELSDALKIVEQQLDYGRADDALKSVRAILEKTK